MIKRWSRLCLLVLAVSHLSRGQDNATSAPHEPSASVSPGGNETKANPPTTPMLPTSPTPYLQTNGSGIGTGNGTDLPQNEDTNGLGVKPNDTNKAVDGNGSTAAHTTASTEVPTESTTLVKHLTETDRTTLKPAAANNEAQTAGFVVLGLIVMIIIVLCVILYLLRRMSRTYSFDLHSPFPTNHDNEHVGTFEQVYLDDIVEPTTAKDQVTTEDVSPTPVGNGTTLQSEESSSNGEKDPEEQPDTNGLETLPISDTSPSLGDEQADNTSTNSANLFFDAIGEEQQNENNNNPSVCSSDPFVEINLDGPAWCDQLLNSPEASSSVLPFSPFSFSSSSSSSSS